MRIILLSMFALLLLAGCGMTQPEDKGTIGDGLGTNLVVDKDGRIIGHPTHLEAPGIFIINGGKPTEREIRLLGVEGLSEEEAPITFAKTKEWLYNYVRNEQEIFIKPGIGTDLADHVIYGLIYLSAVNKETGKRGGYVCVNNAMLWHGLVRIRDLNEIEDVDIREGLKKAQDHAKREKLGLWSNKP